MNRLRHLMGVAAAAVLLSAGAASAQTVNIVSGNGQFICPNCVDIVSMLNFAPLIVRVTDASGQPVAFGTPVNWNITATNTVNGGNLSASTTYTDPNGYAYTNFFPVPQSTAQKINPWILTTITATAGNSSAAFNLTQGLQVDKSETGGQFQNTFTFRVLPDNSSVIPFEQRGSTPVVTGTLIVPGSTFTGQVGSTSATPIIIQALTNFSGQPVPNVAVRLVNTIAGSSTITCKAQAGAGADTVLTDQNGIALCYPVFGGTPNVTGNAYVSVGGGWPVEHYTVDPTGTAYPPTSYLQIPFPGSSPLIVKSTPGVAAALRLISGSGQTQIAGQAFAAPLVVAVQSSTGGGLAGQTVNWTVSPAGAATLSSPSSTTDANGQASTNVTLAGTASGTVTVSAALQGSTTVTPVSFTLTATQPVTYTGLTAVSGNNQSAIINTAFAAPLVVQLNSTSGPASGVPVTFTISGPGTLSSNSATTGSNGQAQVTVQATGTTGAVTVTASAGGFSQTFNLTVSPQGPTLTSASQFMNAADFQRGALSPCSLATLVAQGLAPGLQGMLVGNLFGPLPYNLGGDTVTVGGSAAPILNMGLNPNGQQQITFQVPCDVTPGSSVPVVVTVGAGNGTISIPVQAASPGVFQTVMSDGVSRAVVVRPDGSFVSLQNPARPGENLVAFATGLGAPSSPVGTNSVAAPGATVSPLGTVVVGMAGRGVPLISATLSDELLGVWMVTFTVPTDLPSGNNQTFSISVIPAGSQTPIASATTTIPLKQ